MAAPTPDHHALGNLPEPRWGMGDALVGWVIAYSSAVLLGTLFLALAGYSADDVAAGDLPLSAVALQYPPLWLGFIGVPVFVAATKGNGWILDFRMKVAAIDVPVAAVVGVLTQLVVVPLVSWPMLWLTNTSIDDLGAPARELADKATDNVGAILFLVIVGLGAPIAEEIFFRGLLLRAMEKTFGTKVAVVGSSLAFAATHFQFIQFPALFMAGLVFALLVVRTGRLGAAIIGHMAFNLVTAVALLWL